MADEQDPRYSDFGLSAIEMAPAYLTGTDEDVVDAAYISREHAKKAKYEDNDRTEDSLRHILLGGLIAKSPEQEGTLGRDIASFLIDFREGDAPEDQVDLNNNIYGILEELVQRPISRNLFLNENSNVEYQLN